MHVQGAHFLEQAAAQGNQKAADFMKREEFVAAFRNKPGGSRPCECGPLPAVPMQSTKKARAECCAVLWC